MIHSVVASIYPSITFRLVWLPLLLLLAACSAPSPTAVHTPTPTAENSTASLPAASIPAISPTPDDATAIPPSPATPAAPAGSLLFSSRRLDTNGDGAIQVPDGIQLYRLDLATGRALPLTHGAAYDSDPAPAPDGDRLAFVSTRGGNVGLFLLEMTEGTIQPLTSPELPARQPAWSPDGRTLAFSGGPRDAADIYLVDATGGDVTPLTSSPADDIAPLWLPDGSGLLFIRGDGGAGELLLFDLAAGQTSPLPLPAPPPGFQWRSIRWIPNRPAMLSISAIPVDGSAPQIHLFSFQNRENGPALTPLPLRLSGAADIVWLPDDGGLLAVLQEAEGTRIVQLVVDWQQQGNLDIGGLETAVYLANDPFVESHLAFTP